MTLPNDEQLPPSPPHQRGSKKERRGCSSKELLAHLRSLQRVAAVNQEWRAVALPLFYNTAYVVIGRPLDPLDADDSDDDGMIIGTKWQGVEKDDSMSIANEGQDKADAVNRGDNWDSDNDEEVLKEIGLSRRGVDIGLSTNIGLIHAMGQIGNAHEVQTIVQGEGQTAGQLLRQLLLAKFGRYVWPAVKRLRIDMRDSSSRTQTNTMAERRPNALKDFNELLSALLPSLREIKFYGPHSKAIYGCILIERLIKERLHRPESLHAVRVKADCWPKLTDDYDTGESALPVFIECMEIDGPDETYLMPVPMMVADTLVELKLAPMIEHYGWSLFESLGDLDPTEPAIQFSSLRKLTLNLVNIECELEYRMEKDDCSDQESSYHCVEVDETGYWEPCSVCMRGVRRTRMMANCIVTMC
ncbi:hypothetical protein GGH93_005844 [Coemansia aciculifera]|nr:hypothetical protein GGH93_005844 [Coemansia aciculifera]